MFISLLQHEPGSTTGNCESTTASRSRLTGASTFQDSADPIIKEEPDFVETHCHWVGCDRDLHSQEQLVKVLDTPNSFNLQLFQSSKILI